MIGKSHKAVRNLGIILALLWSVTLMAAPGVSISPTPDLGIQPRLAVDDEGNIHLLYFKKRGRSPSAREGNLYYRQYQPEDGRWSTAIKVSSQAFDLRVFSLERAALAVSGDGRVHVIWYRPKQSQFFYTRSDPERSQFEPQRPILSPHDGGIDAGAEIAALGNRVAVVWAAGDLSKDYERAPYARISVNNGASFGPEIQIGTTGLGACGCCTLAAEFEDNTMLRVAYRSAIDGVGRHMQLLTVHLNGEEMSGYSYDTVNKLQEWEASFCPLSTNDIAIDKNSDRWLVFETKNRIIRLNLENPETLSAVAEPFTKTRQKNPAIVFNYRNEHLIVWGEAISNARGGRLNMRLFDARGELEDFSLPEEITIPNFSFPAVAGLPNGDFLVLY